MMLQLAAAAAETLAGAPSLAAQGQLEQQQAAVAQGGCRETKLKLMSDPDAAQKVCRDYLIDKTS